MSRFYRILVILLTTLNACQSNPLKTSTPLQTTSLPTSTSTLPAFHTSSPTLIPTITPSPTPHSPVPTFSHVTLIILENKEFGTVIGNRAMPNFNTWAQQYALLTQHYAIRHPSLPNYFALIAGDTFGITTNCEDCWIDAPSLPDLIEASGRAWKTYQEDIRSPCFLGSTLSYVQKHNPFVYFDSIRLNEERCTHSVVSLEQMAADLQSGYYPDFAFITPNLWNSAHDGPLEDADAWLGRIVPQLMQPPAYDGRSLIIITWDEGQGNHTCCGLETGGGRIATVFISPLVKQGFQDDTPYTHYSILKTISTAWNLPVLGHTADESTKLIEAVWAK
jgi:hypothetical protein